MDSAWLNEGRWSQYLLLICSLCEQLKSSICAGCGWSSCDVHSVGLVTPALLGNHKLEGPGPDPGEQEGEQPHYHISCRYFPISSLSISPLLSWCSEPFTDWAPSHSLPARVLQRSLHTAEADELSAGKTSRCCGMIGVEARSDVHPLREFGKQPDWENKKERENFKGWEKNREYKMFGNRWQRHSWRTKSSSFWHVSSDISEKNCF